jgi:integrase
MGQIFQRTYRAKDGTLKTCETWTIRYYRSGKPMQETGFKRKGDAVTTLKRREGAISNGVPVTRAVVTLTVDAALADVVKDYQINGKRTKAHVERRIKKHLLRFFGGRKLASITTAHIRDYIADRQTTITHEDGTIKKAGASNAEINRELAILKRACRLALQAGTLLTVPHVPMLREDNIRQGFFERDAFETVRAKLPEHLQPVVTFAYLTGWRIPSEVLTLEWRHIDRDRGIVRLEPGTTKNDRGRTFPYADILTELRDVINAQWEATKAVRARGILCPYVFHRSGNRIRYFRKAWMTACKAAGHPGRIPHDLRRTAVRNLVRAGVPERVAMQLSGHKTRSVFDRYDIVSEADLKTAIGKLAIAHRDSAVTVEPDQEQSPAAVSA